MKKIKVEYVDTWDSWKDFIVMKEKAAKWDDYQTKLKHKADHLNSITKEARVARAKKAVAAREAKRKING